MGTLECPLCCDEKFSSQSALKYHLLSITDNMYCPECSKRFDSILQLANHLDGTCGKSSVNDSNETVHYVTEDGQEHEETSFMNALEPVLQIHEIEIEDANKAPEVEHFLSGPETPMEVEIELDENSSNCEPGNSLSNMIKCEDVVKQEILTTNHEDAKESAVKEEIVDSEPQNTNMEMVSVANEQYACINCGVSFNSIMEHIQLYHTGQEVIVNVSGTGNEAISNLVTSEMVSSMAVENGRTMGITNEFQETSMVEHKETFEPLIKHKIIRPFSTIQVKTSDETKFKRTVHRQPRNKFKRVENSEIRYISKEVKIGKFWEKQPDGEQTGMTKISNSNTKKEVRKFPLKKDNRSSLEKLFSGSFVLKSSSGRGTRPGPYLGVNRVPEVKFIISPGDQGVENTISVYTCNTCQREFGNISAFERHSCSSSAINPLVCKICSIEFVSTRNMQTHMQDVHGLRFGKLPQPVKCSMCNVMFTSMRALKQHEKIHKPVELKVSLECSVCHSLYPNSRTLSEHMKIHSNPEQDGGEESVEENKQLSYILVCRVCCKIFSNKEDLRTHYLEHGEVEEDEDIEKERLCGEVSDSERYNSREGMQNRKNTESSNQ